MEKQDKHERRFTVQLSEHEIELICEGLTQREMWGTGDRLCERLEVFIAPAVVSSSPRPDDGQTKT